MNITFYKPKSDLLSRYIEGFYFISEFDTLKSNQYWTFPSNFCLATICQDTELIPEDNKITIRKSIVKRVESFLFYNISKPVNVTYEEPRNELTIYFKPLAIFHFFPEVSLSSTADHLESFKPYPDYQSKIQDLLKMKITKMNRQICWKIIFFPNFVVRSSKQFETCCKKLKKDGN